MSKRMQRSLIVLTVIVLLVAACQSNSPSIIGKWTGSTQGTSLTMEFTDKGTCTLTASGQSIDCTYKIDMTKKPIELNFDGQALGATGHAETIIEFTDAKTMRMATPADTRPTTFDSQTVTFTKQ